MYQEQLKLMETGSMRQCIDSGSNLVNFTKCSRPKGVRDIVDWPSDTRDGYVMTNINTVVNAYAFASVSSLAELAKADGNDD